METVTSICAYPLSLFYLIIIKPRAPRCIYFLDPEQIVPPSPPAPFIPRTRNNSFSQPDQDPLILEPPVTTNPLLYRPTLPLADIKAIRQLSSRVNVLPVIARADILSNDRLSAIKLAIRRDLAESGIGFGIFDMEGPYVKEDQPLSTVVDGPNGYPAQPNGSASSANSPPTSPATPSLMRLPYALISPDVYSHSDGVPRIPPSRHELVLQYSPSFHQPPPSKLVRGRFTRTYRWGSLDVLDSSHSDFLPLRNAIFHHMEVRSSANPSRLRILTWGFARGFKSIRGNIYLTSSKIILSNSVPLLVIHYRLHIPHKECIWDAFLILLVPF